VPAKPADRTLVLVVAGVSKVIFVVLVLSEGTRYLSYQAGVAIAIDSVMVILFAWYLIASRSGDGRAIREAARLSV